MHKNSPYSVEVFNNIGLSILDTNDSHTLTLKPGSNLTADKTLTLITGDADRELTLSGDPTLGDWFDQAVKQASTPSFAGLTITDAGKLQVNSDGNDKNIQVYHNDTSGVIETSSGGLYLDPASNAVYCYDGSSAFAFYVYDGEDAKVCLHSGGFSYFLGDNVGIGTDTPGGILDIQGSSPVVIIKATNDGGSAVLRMQADQADDNADNYQIVVTDGGPFDIQCYNGSYQTGLTLNNTVQVHMPEVYDDTVTISVRDLEIQTGGKLGYVSSTKEAKIYDISLHSAKWIYDLRPIEFERRVKVDDKYLDKGDGVKEVGLFAEEVNLIRPEIVYRDYQQIDGQIIEKCVGIHYKGLIVPILIEVQQHKKRIAQLERESERLKQEINKLK